MVKNHPRLRTSDAVFKKIKGEKNINARYKWTVTAGRHKASIKGMGRSGEKGEVTLNIYCVTLCTIRNFTLWMYKCFKIN